jgi:hypothetical protein
LIVASFLPEGGKQKLKKVKICEEGMWRKTTREGEETLYPDFVLVPFD